MGHVLLVILLNDHASKLIPLCIVFFLVTVANGDVVGLQVGTVIRP